MKTDLEKLANLLSKGKISENEYKLLSTALENKNSKIQSILSIAINPFQKIAGISALIIGVMIILATSYLGILANVHFPGIIDVKIIRIPLGFSLLL